MRTGMKALVGVVLGFGAAFVETPHFGLGIALMVWACVMTAAELRRTS